MLLETLSHVLPVIQANMNIRLPGFTFKTKARWVQENSGGNRVTFVPQRDNFVEGRQQRGVRRVIRVRVARVTAIIWAVPTKADGSIYKRGETIDPAAGRYSMGQVEAAVNALLCALEDSCKDQASPGGGPQWDVDDGTWMDQDGSEISEYGLGYALPFSVRIPVIYDSQGAATVSSYSAGYIESDSSISVPPP